MMRPVMRERNRFRDAEVQQPDRAIGTNLNVGWLDVAMDHGPLPPVDFDLTRMQFFELVADFGGISGGLYRINTLLKLQDLGDTLSFDILHGHVEAAVHLPAFINLQEPRVGLVELLLEQGAAAFGPQHDL